MAVLKIIERFHSNHEKVGEEFARLFEGELNPVAAKAQKKVPIPEGFVSGFFNFFIYLVMKNLKLFKIITYIVNLA